MSPSGTKGPASPATSPAAKTTGTPPAPTKSPEYGDLFFQPVRTREDTTENDYRNRLSGIQEKAKRVAPVKLSPGSFTLLTKHTKEGFTGDTRFDSEIAVLKKEKERVRQELVRYEELARKANAIDKSVYNELIAHRKTELRSIEQNVDTLTTAGGEHYMTAQEDQTFASKARPMKGPALTEAIEKTQHLTTRDVTARMGREITNRRERDIMHLKAIVEELQAKNYSLESHLKEQAYQINKLIEGKLPEHIKDTLIAIELLLKEVQGGEITLPEEEKLAGMLTLVDNLLKGKLFGPDVQLDIKQELTTTHDILTSLLEAGEDITLDSLSDRGLSKEEAEAVIDLLKKEGIIHD